MFEKLLKKVEQGAYVTKPNATKKNRRKKPSWVPKDKEVLHQLGLKVLKDAD